MDVDLLCSIDFADEEMFASFGKDKRRKKDYYKKLMIKNS
jgi:hypothetical protein